MTGRDLTTLSHRPDPLELIDRLTLADSTKKRYSKVLRDYLDTGATIESVDDLQEYALSLPTGTAAHLAAAVSAYADKMVHHVESHVTPQTIGEAQALTMRFNALKQTIKVKRETGTKAHTWLSQAQVRAMFGHCPEGIIGERDRVLLGLLVGAGLRREEAVNMTFEDLKLQPVKGKMRTVLNVKGKGKKNRVVPISDDLANAIDRWGARIGHEGKILRSLGMNREPGESISAVALFQIVRRYGDSIDKPDLAAHDLRRTFAQLGHEAGVPIPQISKLLGHASIETTMTYLNLELDLETTVSDFVPIR